MANFVTNILLLILGCAFYSSGLLLWPIRRWLCRKRKIRGKALGFLFLAQVAALPIFIFMGTFYSNLLDVGYGWGVALDGVKCFVHDIRHFCMDSRRSL